MIIRRFLLLLLYNTHKTNYLQKKTIKKLMKRVIVDDKNAVIYIKIAKQLIKKSIFLSAPISRAIIYF